jgi:V/A-type H+/Na+-transporting ATPase subunit C
MAGPLSKYSLINAKLRGRISKILPDELFSQLAKAPSVDAALALLRDTPFAGLEEIYSTTGDLKQAELELLKHEIDLYAEIGRHIHPNSKPLVDALLTRYEIDNLKNAIRIFFDKTVRKRAVDAYRHYVLHDPIRHTLPMDIIMNAGNFDEIAGVCDRTPYGAIIRKYSHTVDTDGTLFRMEIGLDHYYYEHLLAAIDQLSSRDRRIALRLIGVEIDLQNIALIIRFKSYYDLPLESVLKALIPGGFNLKKGLVSDLYHAQNITGVLQGFVSERSPELSVLLSEAKADSGARLNLIRRILEEISQQEIQHILVGYPFTIGIILAYFVMKQQEHTKIRKILIAKQYDRKQERIETML